MLRGPWTTADVIVGIHVAGALVGRGTTHTERPASETSVGAMPHGIAGRAMLVSTTPSLQSHTSQQSQTEMFPVGAPPDSSGVTVQPHPPALLWRSVMSMDWSQ
ncbi:MAG: hypothetical protein WCJ30_03635 [Deltaproteobacteria bacterium]